MKADQKPKTPNARLLAAVESIASSLQAIARKLDGSAAIPNRTHLGADAVYAKIASEISSEATSIDGAAAAKKLGTTRARIKRHAAKLNIGPKYTERDLELLGESMESASKRVHLGRLNRSRSRSRKKIA